MYSVKCRGIGFHALLFTFAIFLFLLPPGCVKEDRKACPCTLTLIFPESVQPDGMSGTSLAQWCVSSWGGGLVGQADLPDTLQVPVPKGDASFCAVCPDGLMADDGTVRIPYGEECPPLWMGSASLDLRGDRCGHAVTFHRNFCRLHLRFISEAEPLPALSLALRGCVAGYDACGRPLDGDFRFVPPHSPNWLYRCSLPRQKDDSLMLDIMEGSNVLRSFALGNYIAAAGYDWSAPDLEDIELMLTYTPLRIVLSFSLWQKVETFELVL